MQRPADFTERREFERRHLGPDSADIEVMLNRIGLNSLDQLIEQTIPASILEERPAQGLPAPTTETVALDELSDLADKNMLIKSLIGQGYYGTHTPSVILRNVIESPGWYTAYTPYQAEISQGRLEGLLLFQSMVQELTGLPLANASLLDEGTAAAEAMTLCKRANRKNKSNLFFVDKNLHPQTRSVIETRAEPLGIELIVGDPLTFDASSTKVFGGIAQYPGTKGDVCDLSGFCAHLRASGAMAVLAADLLALVLLKAPGELGADVAIGSSQRFGVPLGFGGPHAGFMATTNKLKRMIPGRIIGVSKDCHGNPALRMALQTREQHIRRDKATSNICTSQVLLANVSAFYAVYHGPTGLADIAHRVHQFAVTLARAIAAAGFEVGQSFFDTLTISCPGRADSLLKMALSAGYNLRRLDADTLCISIDETVEVSDIHTLAHVFSGEITELSAEVRYPKSLVRTSSFLTDAAFNTYHSETAMLRYLRRLQGKDLALDVSMIPLGSCTMKLNATTEMMPITWPKFTQLHPFVPANQSAGYSQLISELEGWLAAATGFHAVSMMPNAGSQGEYSGLLAIRAYHRSKGDAQRNVCLIPLSAHGTNPASAVLAGMKVVVVSCDDHGNIDVDDLRKKATTHANELGALMVTYPSTHGVFEPQIREICEIIHEAGGQVYLDGANMNAMVGLCRPGAFGADVCHLNLHKTFCVPHGGGGPGVGPIGVAEHLVEFLPTHVEREVGGGGQVGAVSSAPYGSPSILPITWAYIRMLGGVGLRKASKVAILNANYIAHRLDPHFPVLYKGTTGRVAHECILDLRPFKAFGVAVDDVAKRLMDYGFHAPTMSFPVPGTLMVEPTESENLAELDRFCDAMISIREEIEEVHRGECKIEDSALRNAPHTAYSVTSEQWPHSYSRHTAAFPAPWTLVHKYWPSVGRIDNAAGDRHLVCSCDAWPTT